MPTGSTETIEEKIFDFAYNMALLDSTRRTKAAGLKSQIAQLTGIRDAIKTYAGYYYLGKGNKEYAGSFDKCVEKIQEIKVGGPFTFGNIQKLINMTMKYLYIRYYGCNGVRERCKDCHAPMDSIMMTFIYESYYVLHRTDSSNKKNGIAPPGFKREGWSNLLDDTEYKCFQCKIQWIIKERKLQMNPIEFDYCFWDAARNVKYDESGKERRVGDRIAEVKKIWGNNN